MMKKVTIILRRLHWWSVTALYLVGIALGHPLMRLRLMVLRFQKKSVIFSIGDSHAQFTFQKLPRVICLPLGPVTMHRVGRDGLLWQKTLVRKGDTVLFSFGEIDCRCHIKKQIEHGRTEEDIIRTLVTSYCDAILEEQMEDVTCGIVSVTPPARAMYLKDFREFSPQGSDDERSRYTQALNDALRSMAATRGMLYIDTYHRYKDADGMLLFSLSDGKTHIRDPEGMRQLLHQR